MKWGLNSISLSYLLLIRNNICLKIMVKMADLITASTFAVGLCCGFLLRSRWVLIKNVLFNSKNTPKPVDASKIQEETEKVFYENDSKSSD